MSKSPEIRIAGIGGSLRPGSYTRMAVETALRGAREAGAATTFVDLRELDLVFADVKKPDSDLPPGVLRLRTEVKHADGLILGTPEYHGSFSGVLKNALDLMGFDEFEGKMLGLVGVSGGAMGAFAALNGLREVGRARHAWVIPEQAAIPEAWRVFAPDGAVKDPTLEQRLLTVGKAVVRFATLHKCEHALEFLRQWQGAPHNPGGSRESR